MFTFLAWAALLCAGLGGTVGIVSNTLAGKLAANVQHLQRQAGTSLATRAARRDHPQVIAAQPFADSGRAVVVDNAGGALPAGEVTLGVDEQRADEPPTSAAEPRLKLRNRAHPSRAPPVLA